MKAKIYCLTTNEGTQSFYLRAAGESYYLFSQEFRRGVKDFFSSELPLDAAIDFSRAGKDRAVIRTMKKIPAYIKYIEKEYGIEVLRKTARKSGFSKGYVA